MENEKPRVIDNSSIRVIVQTTIPDFLSKERIESNFSPEQYNVYQEFNKYKAKKKDYFGTEYDDIYRFYNTLHRIYEVVISNYYEIQIALTEPDNEHLIYEILEKFFNNGTDIDILCFLRKIKCIYYRGYIAESYKDFSDYGNELLLPDLHGDDLEKTMATDGFEYEVTYELMRTDARIYDMPDVLSFRITNTLECDCDTWWKESYENLITIIKDGIRITKTIKR